MDLPPSRDSEKLALELRLAGKHKQDALQEAWLAHLEGRDPIQAVKTFLQREYRIRKRTKKLIELARRLHGSR